MKVILALVLASVACGTPVNNIEPINPQFDAARDVRFLLQTRQNRLSPQTILFRNLQTLQQSHFDRTKPLRVLIHGWFGDDTTDLNTFTSAELLNYYDFNVILLDWGEGAQTINYAAAVLRVPRVGEVLAQQLDFLHQNGFISWDRVAIVGFSLGAHVAGFAGKNVAGGRIGKIIGLDPAGPLYSLNRPDSRLDAGDAELVECVHTNGPTLAVVGAGLGEPIGHLDFWPNGGRSQPGCITNGCSHSRAVEFYVESLRRNGFFALGCPVRNVIGASCNRTPGEWMGGDSNTFRKTSRGSFHLETGRSAPFAQGQVRT